MDAESFLNDILRAEYLNYPKQAAYFAEQEGVAQ